MEEEDVRPVPRMRGEDSEAGCCERRGHEDPQRQPTGHRAKLTEDDAVLCTLRIDRDEREGGATPQPNDHAYDVKRHEQAVTTHSVASAVNDRPASRAVVKARIVRPAGARIRRDASRMAGRGRVTSVAGGDGARPLRVPGPGAAGPSRAG